MISHELLDFFAMVAAGVVGSLIATPFRNAVLVVAKRSRPIDRR